MREEFGRSLIEMIGVMTISAVVVAGAFGIYNTIRNNQQRTIAYTELEQIAKNAKILMGARGDYSDISIDYLVKAGALNESHAPIGNQNWSITPSIDGKSFSINLTGLTRGNCDYFASTPNKWATKVLINGYEADDACFSSDTNNISFVIE